MPGCETLPPRSHFLHGPGVKRSEALFDCTVHFSVDRDVSWTRLLGASPQERDERFQRFSPRAQARLCLRALGRAADPPWVDRSAS
jgi:hypothetical protein